MKWLPRSTLRRLLLVATFAHIDVDTLHRVEFSGQSRCAAESWLRRMVNDGWLQSAPLDDKRVYYRLTRKAVLYLKHHTKQRISRTATKALSTNRKLEKHALLLYCTRSGGPDRIAYRPCKDASRFEDIVDHVSQGHADPLRQKLFYAEANGDETTIGYFVVDRGQERFVDAKLKPKVFSLFRWSSFERLADTGVFRLTVVTVEENRMKSISAELQTDQPPIPWNIEVMTELQALLPRRIRIPGVSNG